MRAGDPVTAAVRPEYVETSPTPLACCNALEARVEELDYRGDHSRIHAALDGGGSLVIRTSGTPKVAPGQRIPIGWCTDRCFAFRSEEHTSELQSLMRISYAVFCLKKKKKK